MTNETISKNYLENIGPIITIATAIGFLCSLTYNYGYFYGFSVDVRLLSLSDIFSSYSLWAPILLSTAIGLLTNKTLKLDQTKNKPVANIKSKIKKRILNFMFLLVFIELIWYPLLGPSWLSKKLGLYYYLFIYISYAWAWKVITDYVIGHHKFKNSIDIFYSKVLTYVILIFLTMFITGLIASSEQSMQRKPNIYIYMNGKSTQNQFILLRYLEQGLLVKEAIENGYVLITWDEINRIEIVPSKPYRGILRNLVEF